MDVNHLYRCHRRARPSASKPIGLRERYFYDG